MNEDPAALDDLSEAAHFEGRYDEAIVLRERAFAGYRRAERPVEAAAAARWLAFLHGAVRGNGAAASGWMSWAERLLQDVDTTIEHGRLALDRAPWTDDPAERERHAMAALTIARQFGDRNLEFSAQALLGHSYVLSGRIDEGMRLIDEAMAAVAGGEVVEVVSIGEIYCRLLGACERATDVRRAEQWMAAAEDFAAWGDFVAPTCRLHYGGILMAVGRWDEAESELLAAQRTFEGGYRGMRNAPLVRLAGLRLRQGRLEEAEALLDGAESRSDARRVLAEVALARGDAALAVDLAGVCLEGQADGPDCVPILELLVSARIARDDLSGARAAHDRLASIAAAAGPRAQAGARLMAGRLLAAERDDRAASELDAAHDEFVALSLPLEAARAQLELARVMQTAGAVAEARAALTAFDRLGAAADADAAAALLRSLGEKPARAGPRGEADELTKREREVLALVAQGMSNPEIADRLFISRKTAQHHVAHILGKLGVRTRAEAAAYAARNPAEK